MRTLPLLPAALLLSVIATADTAVPPCPEGSRVLGEGPPAGLELRCVGADGRAEGPWLTWYGNGQLMSERQMQDDREHGRQRSWWPNGQLMMEGISMEGQRLQGFRYWSITGQPTELPTRTQSGPESTPKATP